MTSSSKIVQKGGKLLDLPLLTSTEKGGVGIFFFGGWAPGKGRVYPYFLGGLQTQCETMNTVSVIYILLCKLYEEDCFITFKRVKLFYCLKFVWNSETGSNLNSSLDRRNKMLKIFLLFRARHFVRTDNNK